MAGNDDFDDDYGHGTHVAGTIGAATNNRLGVAGVMWDVELLPVKVLNERGRGGEWELVHGLLYAAGLLDEPDKPRNPYPADVINLSLGSRAEMVHLRDAVERISRETNCILVAAAGNGWGPGVYYPARYPEVIAVGAVDYNYPHQPQRTRYSSYGPVSYTHLDVYKRQTQTFPEPGWNNHPPLIIESMLVFTGEHGSFSPTLPHHLPPDYQFAPLYGSPAC